jgi:hypothetical protein
MIRLRGGLERVGYFTFSLFWGLLLGCFPGGGSLERPRTGRYMHAYLHTWITLAGSCMVYILV